MITQLKKGDKVVTTGGILGTISSIQEDYAVLTVGDSDTKIEVLKSAIAGLRT
jgi:preprotein translocase subunit YajC